MAFKSLVLSFFHALYIYLFLPLFTVFSRLQRDAVSVQIKHDRKMVLPESDEHFRDDPDIDSADKSGIPDFRLKFMFPTGTGSNNLSDLKVVPSNGNNKYEFAPGKSPVRAFIDEPQTFPVQEIILDEIRQKGKVVLGLIDGAENRNKKSMETSQKKKEDEESPGNQGFLDESHFCSSDKDIDSFLSVQDFRSEKIVAEYYKNGKPGLKCSSVYEEIQELPEVFRHKFDSSFLSDLDFNDCKTMRKESSMIPDSEQANKLETLWEHQELIEQLKMELRKVRATGLPTILEESESPRRIADELKTWKIEENLRYEDHMDEVNKLYKSYVETMRKFDILNYQKMYAMGFLQLKDPFKPTTQQKPSPSTLKSLISQNLWLSKHRRQGSDPVKKFVNELQGDLEVVYVGQVCLSWEFLRWQYEKAFDLWNSDSHEIHHYNEVASEFQQFQVLVQRFIEDEPFQGHRVQSYVKTRCVLRNLLQVPIIREDELKDKKNKAKRRDSDDEYTITSETLVGIVEETIRILWQFIRSDKDCNTLPINSHKKTPQPHNPRDQKLLSEVKKTLLKKERKLRDVMRSEKCILRRLQLQTKRESDDSEQVLLFFAQVDLKLICRVLSMSKITRDQLLWCHNKLSKISFVNRKITVDPAFLLFPC